MIEPEVILNFVSTSDLALVLNLKVRSKLRSAFAIPWHVALALKLDACCLMVLLCTLIIIIIGLRELETRLITPLPWQ